MKANKENFYMSTNANFIEIEKPSTKPDFISSSGSQYWYTNNGVIRFSGHWNCQIASCNWTLSGGNCGYCAFDDFEHDPVDFVIYSKNEIEGYENKVDDSGNYYVSLFTNFDNCSGGYVHFKDVAICLNKYSFMCKYI